MTSLGRASIKRKAFLHIPHRGQPRLGDACSTLLRTGFCGTGFGRCVAQGEPQRVSIAVAMCSSNVTLTEPSDLVTATACTNADPKVVLGGVLGRFLPKLCSTLCRQRFINYVHLPNWLRVRGETSRRR
jgi:hypothetical protein